MNEEDMDNASSALSELSYITGCDIDLDKITVWICKEEVEQLFSAEESFDILDFATHEIKSCLQKFHVQHSVSSHTMLEEKNWNEEWEAQIEPVWVSKDIVIAPTWKAEAVHASRKLLINPQMSFGTGHHETTRMMVQLLSEVVQAQSRWIDIGTGTGVLAIMMVLQGAEHVLAFDNDEWAVHNARENIALNSIADGYITVIQADMNTMSLPDDVDGIAANLHKNLLQRHVEKLYTSLQKRKGTLLVSGILVYDEDEVRKAIVEAGFTYVRSIHEHDWCAMEFKITSDSK